MGFDAHPVAERPRADPPRRRRPAWWTDGTVEGTMTLDLHPAIVDGPALQAWANGMLRIGLDLGLSDQHGLWLDAEDGSNDVEPV